MSTVHPRLVEVTGDVGDVGAVGDIGGVGPTTLLLVSGSLVTVSLGPVLASKAWSALAATGLLPVLAPVAPVLPCMLPICYMACVRFTCPSNVGTTLRISSNSQPTPLVSPRPRLRSTTQPMVFGRRIDSKTSDIERE